MRFCIISVMFGNVPDICIDEMRSCCALIPDKVGGFGTRPGKILYDDDAEIEKEILDQLEVIKQNMALFQKHISGGGDIQLYITLGNEKNPCAPVSVKLSYEILVLLSKFGIRVGIDR